MWLRGKSREREVSKREEHIPKFIKPNRPTLIHIKHPNHHLHRIQVKMRVIPIHQRISEFFLPQLPCPAFVHRFEQGKQRGVVVALRAWGGGCRRAGYGRGAPMVSLRRRTEAVVLRGRGRAVAKRRWRRDALIVV